MILRQIGGAVGVAITGSLAAATYCCGLSLSEFSLTEPQQMEARDGSGIDSPGFNPACEHERLERWIDEIKTTWESLARQKWVGEFASLGQIQSGADIKQIINHRLGKSEQSKPAERQEGSKDRGGHARYWS